MAGESRRQEIQEIHKDYKWHYVVFAVVVVLGIGIWIGAAVFADDPIGYAMNLATEGLGVVVSIAITVVVIDRMYERRDRRRLKARLIVDAGSRSNDKAIDAIEQMRRIGWLIGSNGLLSGANLKYANLQGADLSNANLQGANLNETNLRKADLRSANLREADLWKTKMQEAEMCGTKLQGAFVVEAELKNAKLYGALLQDATLRAANMHGTDLTGSDLRGADLSDAHLQSAILRRANLAGATLHLVNLQGADLGKVDLKSADLFGVNLQESKLDRAILENANLRNVNLERANLLGASLAGATFSLSEPPVAAFRHNPRGEPGEIRQSHYLPPTQLTGATLPDGATFPENPSSSENLERFTNPGHPEFGETLEKINKIRRDWELIE